MSFSSRTAWPTSVGAGAGQAGAVRTFSQRIRTAGGRAATVLAFLLLWVVLVSPDQLDKVTLGAFLRIPLEGLAVVALAVTPQARRGRVVAVLAGAGIALMCVVKILDIGFFVELDRPFNPISDWGSFGPAVGVLRDSVGRFWTWVALIAAVLLVAAVLVFVTLAAVRVTTQAARHRTGAARTVGVLAIVWALCAAFGVQAFTGVRVASATTAALVDLEVHRVSADLRDQHAFTSQLTASDRYAMTPGKNLLAGLRGKDVIIAFVESYGRVAVQDSTYSPQVDAILNSGTSTLRAAGFSSKSAFLTSPTFGGISWLAHSTLQSGLWVDTPSTYGQLLASNRFTLSDAFNRAGWRTVADVPSNEKKWPEGKTFYHYGKIYGGGDVGYKGPNFSYAAMPDQYTFAAFQRAELAQLNHAPVMAEIDLVSSHTPWAPLPSLVDWNAVGDGSVFDGMPAQGRQPADVWRTASDVKAAYGQSIEYSLTALISWVQRVHDDNLVLVVLGDHQPATIVTGSGASHDVPVTIIAHDRSILDRISSWGWQDGMLPSPLAAVWRMDTFRNRFLAAYAR